MKSAHTVKHFVILSVTHALTAWTTVRTGTQDADKKQQTKIMEKQKEKEAETNEN
jgi:hypothetical protein